MIKWGIIGLGNMGYKFAEAKGSILNDDIHQTYKVGVDMIYILDITQVGCTREKALNKECKFAFHFFSDRLLDSHQHNPRHYARNITANR